MSTRNSDLNTLREQVNHYVENCHLDDGGYFFARIPPSSAMDTFYAIKTMSMLGLKPDHPAKTKNFLLSALKEGSWFGIDGLFAAVEVLCELNSYIQLSPHYLDRINLLKNSMGGFGVVNNLDIEVVSEMETTYRVLRILTLLSIDFDKRQITDFVLKFRNEDGGFGKNHFSTLASTFYATEIFKLIEYSGDEFELTTSYLRSSENEWKLNFIEDVYWMSHSLTNLGQKPDLAEWIISFVKDCQRSNGGFARKGVMGIPTLEYTYYAVSILRTLSYV